MDVQPDIRLLPVEPSHIAGFQKIAAAAVKAGVRQAPWPEPKSRLDVPRWVRLSIENRLLGKAETFSVVNHQSEIVGATRLRIFRPGIVQAELSYWIAPAFRGRHFASEAAARTVEYAFRELLVDAVEAPVLASNQKSLAVIRALHMERMEEFCIEWPRGSLQTVVRFSIAAGDWALRSAA